MPFLRYPVDSLNYLTVNDLPDSAPHGRFAAILAEDGTVASLYAYNSHVDEWKLLTSGTGGDTITAVALSGSDLVITTDVATWTTDLSPLIAGGSIIGSGVSGQVTYWNGIASITGEAGFEYDAALNRLLAQTYKIPETTSSTVGIFFKDTARFIHTYKPAGTNDNLFIGKNAGNFTLSATSNFNANVSLGESSLASLTSGYFNTGLGMRAGQFLTQGFSNVFIGLQASRNATTGSRNISIGESAHYGGSGAHADSDNLAIGHICLYEITSGTRNVGVGNSALQNNTNQNDNTAVGYGAATTPVGSESVAVGSGTIITGGGGVAVGYGATSTSNSVAIGRLSQATHGNGSISIGTSIITSGIGSLTLGSGYAGSYTNDIPQTAVIAISSNPAFVAPLQSWSVNFQGNMLLAAQQSITAATISTYLDASATNTITIRNGTPPGGNLTDEIQLYASDRTAGKTGFTIWTEDGTKHIFSDYTGIGTLSPTAFLHVIASTTAAASFRMASGTSPTSPNEGDLWNDSTQKTNISFIDGIKQSLVGTIFTQTADKTVSNTTTETSIVGTGVGGRTLPANFFVAGKTTRITMNGVYSTVAITGDTVTIKVKYGSTVLASKATTALVTGGTNLAWEAELLITCRTTGATGTVQVGGGVTYQIAGAVATYDEINNGVATSTLDTTASGLLDITVTHSAANAANTVTSLVSAFEVLN